MGVRGLTTYIHFKQDVFLHQFFLHDSNLIIDGHSLCAQLYRSLTCFSAFGGDYDKFASYVRNFFKNLRKCKISPYVLFDGAYETRKLRTAYGRLRSKINGASRLDPVTQSSIQIFPILLRDVFKDILLDLNVPFTICEFEADDEIAAMARHLNCPVLSYDSDFFIYNVLYIPFNTLEFKPKSLEVDGEKVCALECRIYKVEHLTNHFGGLKEELLPLLATLLGNDFVEKRVFNKFFSQLKMPKSKLKKNEQQRCIHGLFKWLQNETLDSAITKILGRLRKAQKNKVFAIIKKSVAGYNRTQCPSLKYFNINNDSMEIEPDLQIPDNESVDSDVDNTNESSDDEESSNDDIDLNDSQIIKLPEWLEDGIRHKYIPQSYINLYVHHLHFCSPQAEDYTDEDSFLCTLPILRFAFDVLTDYSCESFTYVSRDNNNSYKRILVGPENSVSRLLNKPFDKLCSEELKSYFFHFLKTKMSSLDLSVIELLPNNFQLYMISMLWWISNCKVALAHIHSLLLCYIMLDVIDEKTGTYRGHNHFHNKYSKKVEEIKKKTLSSSEDGNEPSLNKNKVQYEDCLLAASVLLQHFELDKSIQKRPKSYNIRKMHSFAQFQCCLQQFNFLNTLCRNPFESTNVPKSFNGTFVYNIALKLDNQIALSAFLEQYLKGASTVLMFYRTLCAVYDKFSEKMSLSTSWSGNKRRRRRKAKNNDNIGFNVEDFEFEVTI